MVGLYRPEPLLQVVVDARVIDHGVLDLRREAAVAVGGEPHDGPEAQVVIGALEAGVGAPRNLGRLAHRGARGRVDPANLHASQHLRDAYALVQDQLVEDGRGRPRGKLGELLAVLHEGVVRRDAVLVADDAPLLHHGRVPGDLGPRLVGEGRRERHPVRAGEERLRLLARIEVAVPAVAVLGELLEQHVVVVLDADADGDQPQRVPAVGIRGGLEDGERIGRVHVRHAVGHQDDVVVGVRPLAPGFVRQLHAEVEAGLHVRALVGREVGDRLHHRAVIGRAVLHRVAVEHVGGEVHDGDAVLGAEALPDRFRRCPGDGDTVPPGHRSRGVQHEGHVEGDVVAHVRRLEGHPREVPVPVERVPNEVAADGEPAVVARSGVLVVEAVDPLLGAHGVGVDGVAVAGPGERKEVGRAVGIEAEGGDGVRGRVDEDRAVVVLERRVRGPLRLRRRLLRGLGRTAATAGHGAVRGHVVCHLLFGRLFFGVVHVGRFLGHRVVGHVIGHVVSRGLRSRVVGHFVAGVRGHGDFVIRVVGLRVIVPRDGMGAGVYLRGLLGFDLRLRRRGGFRRALYGSLLGGDLRRRCTHGGLGGSRLGRRRGLFLGRGLRSLRFGDGRLRGGCLRRDRPYLPAVAGRDGRRVVVVADIAGAASQRPRSQANADDQHGGRRCRNPWHPANGGGSSTQQGEARWILFSQASLDALPEVVRGAQLSGLLGEVLAKALFHLPVRHLVTRHCRPPPSLLTAQVTPASGGAPGAVAT